MDGNITILIKFKRTLKIDINAPVIASPVNNGKNVRSSFYSIKKSTLYANKLGLKIHAGHGLTYKSAAQIAKIKNISEFNIGHFIISESLFIGLKNSIKKFKKVINK